VEGEEGRGSARVAALSYRSGVPERHPNSSGIKSGPGLSRTWQPGGAEGNLALLPPGEYPGSCQTWLSNPLSEFRGA